MVVVMQERANDEQVQHVIAQLVEMGFDVHRSTGALRTVIGAVGGNRSVRLSAARGARRRAGGPAHHRALQARQPDLPAREHGHHHRRPPHRRRRGHRHGGSLFGRDRRAGRGHGGGGQERRARKVLRGGAFKPRSSPYSFQGLGEEGLQMLRGAADRHNLKLVSEVMDISQLELIETVRRHPAGRRAQHAELHAAARARPVGDAGAA